MDSQAEEISIKLKLAIACLSLLENTTVTLIFPLLPFIVSHYLSSQADERSISEFSGYLEGAYRLSQFIACIWVSILSDKIGRKKVLIFTTSMQIFASVSLAFCQNYTQAFINRTIAGLCAGSTPITKSIIREITTDKTISQLYSVFALGVGLANIVGPLFALTANPGKSMPEIFGGSTFFSYFPYSLPLVLHGLLGILTLIIISLYLKEPTKLINDEKVPISSLFSNKMYLATVFIYFLIGFVQFGFRLIFALICKSPARVGGMGIEFEYQVSFIQLCAGVFLIFLPPFLTSRLSVKFGILNSLVCLCFTLAPVFVLLGICGLFSGVLQYAGLVIVFILGNSSISVAIFYISICISNTVSRNILGTANGFSQAIVGISRFISSASFGLIYGWSVSEGLEIAGIDAKFACFILSLIPILNGLLTNFIIDPKVQHKKTEENSLSLNLIEKKV